MTDSRKIQPIKGNELDKSSVFIELNSLGWRAPHKISLEELIEGVKLEKNVEYDSKSVEYDISNHIDKKTIIIDPNTLKIKVDDSLINTSNVYHDSLKKDIISIYKPPKDASEISGLHLMSDQNYLYVWAGNRWKRVILSEWE